ncbi:MAG: hypothetical protein IID30_10010 [Planctomycetes bacterium]|nr:hypothetical protein [Planctomycetota bacterium]MCH7602332.1 hypothetical protein [Planctomycetota bacterium]
MRRITVIPMLFAMMMLLTGCNIILPFVIILAPDPKVEAAYKLQDRPTVVFVDDRNGVVSPTTLRRLVADRISQDLMLKKVVTRTISPRDAEAVARQRDSHNKMLAIDAIGRAVGAEQVIYVEIIEFKDRIDRYTLRPRGVCRVRVLDVTNRVRLFPPPDAAEASQIVEVLMDEMQAELYNSRASRSKIGEALANQLGEMTAKLFYKYNGSKLGTNLRGG